MSASKPETTFLICLIAGFGLMFALWLSDGEITGFFLLLFLVLMTLLRWRFPKLKATVLADGVACILLAASWEYAQYALIFALFEGMYRRFYWIGAVGLLIFQRLVFNAPGYFEPTLFALMALGGLCGLFLNKWGQEQDRKFALRDVEAVKFFELEHLQSSIMDTLPQIERMTAVAERARIARDIHDNAGHEIVAAYISFQTMRTLLDTENAEILELYDAALLRLSAGVGKIRDTAHNLHTVTATGAENLLEICQKFPCCPVNFRTYGDTSRLPIYVWSMFEACLNESLTNTARHARASYVSVELGVTQHIARFCIENDGVAESANRAGIGLRNLQSRAASVGGSLSVDAGKVFRVICVVPITQTPPPSLRA